jgi:hypothetical protein
MYMKEKMTLVELSDAELDLVAAGKTQEALLEVDVVVKDINVLVKDINVNVNALTGPVINANA